LIQTIRDIELYVKDTHRSTDHRSMVTTAAVIKLHSNFEWVRRSTRLDGYVV